MKGTHTHTFVVLISGSLFFGHGDDDGLIVAMMRNDQLGYNLAHVLSQSLIYACLVVRGAVCTNCVAQEAKAF